MRAESDDTNGYQKQKGGEDLHCQHNPVVRAWLDILGEIHFAPIVSPGPLVPLRPVALEPATARPLRRLNRALTD
nr:hypothetical protein GCM10025699_16830 [Microbacterium flavescens]